MSGQSSAFMKMTFFFNSGTSLKIDSEGLNSLYLSFSFVLVLVGSQRKDVSVCGFVK